MDGEIIITITLTPTHRGYQLHVGSMPQDAFSDQLVEACRRAANYLENEILARRIIQIQHPRLIG